MLKHNARKTEVFWLTTTCSPYAYSPITIDCGPGLATYWVPKHLLRSPKWSTTDAGGTLCLLGVSAATGHTLVHYLYTSTYQALEARGEDAITPAHTKFKQALLTFVLASTYELDDLKRLAKKQIEIHGSHMALVEVLDSVRKEFSKTTCSWFHEYLQARAEEQFDLDYTFFTSTAFVESMGEGTLYRFMTSHLLEIFSEKLTHTLQSRKSHGLKKEKPDAVLEEIKGAPVNKHSCPCYHSGHQTGMCTASDKMSSEFPSVSCEEVDDVLSLDNSSVPDCADGGAVGGAGGNTWGFEDTSKPTDDCGGNLWDSAEKKKKDSSGFDFDFDAFKGGAEPTPPVEEKPVAEEGWGSGTTTKSKKKSKKWGLIEEPVPEPAPALEPEKKDEEDPWSFTFGGATEKKKKKGKKGALEELSSPPPEPEQPAEPEPEPVPEPVKEEDPWASAGTPIGKKGKKGKHEPTVEEPPPPPAGPEPEPVSEPKPEPVPEPEPELVVPKPEPEPEPVKEEPAVDPFAGLNKSQKKRLQKQMKLDAKAEGEEDTKRKVEEVATELVRQEEEAEAQRIRLEEEKREKKRIEEEEAAAVAAAAAAESEKKKDDPMDSWGGVAPTTKKKKKKKGAKEEPDVEEPPPPPPEPEPVIEPEPVPPAAEKTADNRDNWGAAAAPIKKSKKGKKRAPVIVPDPEPIVEKTVPEPAPEPEPEPIPEAEPNEEEKNEGGDWGLSSIWGGGKKKKKKCDKSAEPEPPPPEPEPEFAEPLAVEDYVQEPEAVEEPKAKDKDKWGLLS
jgi:hypothetical protein